MTTVSIYGLILGSLRESLGKKAVSQGAKKILRQRLKLWLHRKSKDPHLYKGWK